MSARLQPFQRCISNRFQKVFVPGRADKTSKRRIRLNEAVWEQSSQVRPAFDFASYGIRP
jgi:hypothetical protein